MKKLFFICCAVWLNGQESYPVDWEVVAKIREEGFQRSRNRKYILVYDGCFGGPPHQFRRYAPSSGLGSERNENGLDLPILM